ncbi:complex I assembly factor ACAD9, mitochondrial [Uranotaenia lowii]|uniref:complex I assembly factor ACAD9, mitochondrial n=1 Tax=Uranotaenia lowii TaxID=190385 RepID=UPI002478E7C9|nr:complex I assembly factor ACAD9, mitochondrial [Uranotaenia lowii]
MNYIARPGILSRFNKAPYLSPKSISAMRWKSSMPSPQAEAPDRSSDSEIKINTKPQHLRMEKREPFLKNLFVGQVDTDLLVYPESLSRDEQSRLVKERESLERVLKDSTSTGKLEKADVFSLQSPLNYGGKHLIETELAYFNEIISQDFSTAVKIGQHNAIVQLVNKFATETVKDKLLKRLSNGEHPASCAIFEKEAPSGTLFSTTANLDSTGRSWLLNGTKSFVINGDNAGYFLVLASTGTVDQISARETTVTTFLVSSETRGVKKLSSDETLGLNDVKQLSIGFENVELTNDDIIGTTGNGTAVLVELLKSTRVQTSVLGIQLMKRLLNNVVNYSIETKAASGHIMDFETVREQVARSACSIYAAESMVYLTTGLLDDFSGQDADIEAAATKIFTSERMLQTALQPLQFIGPQVLIQSEYDTLLRDSIQFYGHGETLDSIKFFVALSGLQHAGMASHETIKKDRNPAMNPSHVISKLFEKNTIDTPKQFVNLEHYLHPSLDPAAHWIEFSIMRLKLATECVLSRHGTDIVNHHIEQVRLADIAVLVYAMIATASRASRSYCIGLQHGEQEIHLANMFCKESCETVRRLAKDLEQGQFLTNDSENNALARYLFRQKKYFFEHPLKKNF